MFNVKALNDAILQLSDEGKAEIQKMVNVFSEYKQEVERLEEVAEGFEQLSIRLQKDKENLEYTVKSQAAKIAELIKTIDKLTVEK